MKDSQARIQAIQERLQAITADQDSRQPATHPSPMVELTPNARNVVSPSLEQSSVARSIDLWEQRSPQSPSYRPTTLVKPAPQGTVRSTYPESELTAQVGTLNQRAQTYVQQRQQPRFQQPLPQPTQVQSTQVAPSQVQAFQQAQQRLDQQMTAILQRLESQVAHINQLSASQETAMLELKMMTDKAEQELKALVLDGELPPSIQIPMPSLELEAATVPHAHKSNGGRFVLTARSVNLFQSEQDAVMMAELLRNRSQSMDHRTQLQPPTRRRTRSKSQYQDPEFWWRWVCQQVQTWVKVLNPPTSGLKSKPSKPSRLSQTRSEPEVVDHFTVQEGLVWLGGAIAARIAINILLDLFSWMWFPAIGLITIPAAIAVYQATTSPQSGFVWGCRLFLIMIGLLIGGRLM
jgi:hypothetical protein